MCDAIFFNAKNFTEFEICVISIILSILILVCEVEFLLTAVKHAIN